MVEEEIDVDSVHKPFVEVKSKEATDLASALLDDSTHPLRPINWSKPYKWTVVVILSLMRLTAITGTLICAPAAPTIVQDLGSDNSLYVNLLTSIWELGEACGPLLVAPMSEVLEGRQFFQEMFVASICLDSSVVGDMFPLQERGKAMAIGGIAGLIGPIAGPIIGGYMAPSIGWRWTFWVPAIMGAVCELLFIALLRETYWPRIVRGIIRKMPASQKAAEIVLPRASGMMRKACIRPISMLFKSPVLLCVSLYGAAVYGYLYLLLTSVEEAFQSTYGLSTGDASLSYIGNGVGMVIGVIFCHLFLDRLVQARKKSEHINIEGHVESEETNIEKRTTPDEPNMEGRIITIAIAGFLMPAGLILYGWTLQYRVNWAVPSVGLGLVGFGITLTIIPTFAYLVDVFGTQAASAVAASLTLRCITGALVPLAASALYGRLGQGWGNSLLAFISLALLPMPLLLIKYGKRLRAV